MSLSMILSITSVSMILSMTFARSDLTAGLFSKKKHHYKFKEQKDSKYDRKEHK